MKELLTLVVLLFVLPSATIADWYLLPSPTNADITSISSLNKDTLYFCCSNGGVYRTVNGGLNWTLIRSTGGNGKIQFINYSTGFLTCSASLLKTTNTGSNWNSIGNACDFSFVNENTGWMTCGDSLIRRTTNSGVTWEYHMINSFPGPGNYVITGLSALNSDTAFVTAQQTQYYPEMHIISTFKTMDGGINWGGTYGKMQATGNMSIGTIYFYNDNCGIFHAFHRELEWFLYHYVHYTVDGGNTWGLTLFYDVITFGFGSCSLGWASTVAGIYYTTNSGHNWTSKSLPTTNTIRTISMINEFIGYCAGDAGTILKTTDGGGLYTSISKNENYTNAFSLSQNYPNPFNPSTKIKFQIPLSPLSERGVGGFVTLKIYDILGREVATLVNQQLKPGTYEVEWDGTNYPSGVYFYKLTSGDFSSSKKMVLVK
jgi:photosystem II stability/assembly factor-like uncharacterized protein